MAGKRLLILLDNVRDSAQVKPLLPGSPTCTVLITSRQRLTDLVASGAHQLDLDVLADTDARDLLAQFVGSARVAVETAAVTDLVLTCVGLPLAIGIVAARANTHPGFPLSALAAELRDARKLSSSMADADEVAINLDAVFSSSYRILDPDTARLFGLVGLVPGPDISTPAAASLAALSTTRARTLLRTLEDAHLLQQPRPGRYRMHDLIRRYAAHQQLDQDLREAGLRRVIDFYLHTAYHADRLLHPHRLPIQLDPPVSGVHLHALPDIPAALEWFDSEHPALIAALHTATRHAWHSTAWQLAWALQTFHVSRGYRHDRLAVLQVALNAAAHLPDPTAGVLAHRLLGDAYTDLGCYEEAMGHLHQALMVAEENHDADQQARTHRVLAWAWAQRGEHRQALEHATRALELWRTFNYSAIIAEILNDMGWYAAQLGQYDTARTHCNDALELARNEHDTRCEASVLVSLGYLDHHIGHHRQAIHHYQQACARYRDLGDTYRVADCLEGLGHPHTALGEHQQARAAWQEALGLHQEQHRDTRADGIRKQLADLDGAQ
ncbi:tetratricopeptide repeat protein [Amycolatopsis saalfeldensis]|uniref:Tfp pilus assembly protein PilF n=1 Tax=Amycolatopsis saalfeldensis TaxID=394193 RepID=A0A1H8YCD4_9PSEU|nr:tetratricopeptide repeat protein [Amycolatopsis saalfeldensis]SEP49747.1 Tfp pilus assembly protein PilF [Amycolatopsis saalfeldensis]